MMQGCRDMVALAALLLVVAPVAAADTPRPTAIEQVEPGRWALKEIASTDTQSVCVTDPRLLVQVEHRGAQCSRFVVEAAGPRATVRYTCPGAGHGLTTVMVENPRLIRLTTRGIVNGAPFDHDYEGRRVGRC